MAEEELNLEEEEVNKVEKRIKSLSEKVKLTSEERDEKAKLLEQRDAQLADVSKERDFLKGFNQVSAKYQGASEYQDKIYEKVKAGYDVEDAAISILAKEGKYTPSPVERETAAGGSAANVVSKGGSKDLKDMSRDEMRAALKEAEAKGEFTI